MSLTHVKHVLEKYRSMLFELPNVVGFTPRIVDDKAVIVLFLEREPIPGELPHVLDGMQVMYEVTGGFELLSRTDRIRPAVGGISIGHGDIKTAGTLGAIMVIGETRYLMSCNHVIAGFNRANPGDPIIQPGQFDNGSSPCDNIAYLDSFYHVKFPLATNKLDFAIAEVTPEYVDDLILDTFPLREMGSDRFLAPISRGMRVFKSGRTTGITEGVIVDTDADAWVRFPFWPHIFTDQIRIAPVEGFERFSYRGDSGSCVFTEDGRFVGMVFAGSRKPPYTTVVMKARNIVDWVDFRFRPGSLHPVYGMNWPFLGALGLVGLGGLLAVQKQKI